MGMGTHQHTHGILAFLKTEAAGGIVMLVATALALLAANSMLAEWYQSFIHLPVGGGYDLGDGVKDVLMVAFFLLIGMELKREMAEGVLADKRQVLLPLVTALGGMAVPAAVFLLVNHGMAQHTNGWAIASATDIAFALCVLTLAAPRAPAAVKMFLMALAIFDDLGAIIIIALCYSAGLEFNYLLAAGGLVGALYALNRFGCMRLAPYCLVGTVLCYFLHHAGIHTTIGGVLVGMAIPLHDKTRDGYSPLEHCMHVLHPWVSFLVLPLFAFSAAGVDLREMQLATLSAPLTLGVLLGLFIGKQVGIMATGWLAIRLRLAALPDGTSWRQFYAVAILAGIGFTMSLFIGALAFSDAGMQEQVKLGVLAGSLASACVGGVLLARSTKAS